MIASLARKSSVCDATAVPAAGELHLWLGRCEAGHDSDRFLRQVLAHYTNSSPGRTQLVRGRFGKPALASPDVALDFNLSHSGAWSAMVVSNGAPVGIDLEYCDPRRDVMKLARRCFREAELADLSACSPALRIERFYDYWTLKEAHIKASGGSLARELETTGFTLNYPGGASGGELAGSIVAHAPASTVEAWYCLLQPIADYRLALCCHASLKSAPAIRLFEVPGEASHIPPFRAVSATAVNAAGELCA